MTEKFKPFTTTLLGSMPRSEELVEARSRQSDSPEAYDEYQKILRDETEEVVRFQENLDLDVIVSGELDRDNYMSYVAQHVPGIKLLTMEELVELTSTKDSFEASLVFGDADGTEIKNPIVVDKIDTQAKLDADEIAAVQKITDRKVKATLPSPYLLTRSCWLDEVTADVYENKQALGDDIVELLINEVHRLADLGVDIIQLDDPILSEVVFTAASEDTSFYWGALSAKVKADKELRFAQGLIIPVLEAINETGVTSAFHICRGNYTRNEDALLVGAYDKLVRTLEKLPVDVYMLEFSTPRAGELDELFYNNDLSEKIILGLGVVNPRHPRVETVEEIIDRAEEALKFVPPEQVWLNPDCGFETFSHRPMNPYDIIEEKIANMVEASKILQEKYIK